MHSIFGENWRTSLAALIGVTAWFISENPDFVGSERIISICRFIAAGGLAVFGINAKDKQNYR